MTSQRSDEITLNSDLGEGLGLHSFGNDEALMQIIDVANVACGFHAGDPAVLEHTVALAKEHGVRVGAHPGLPDITGFGRREMKLSPEEVDGLIRYQVGALVGFLKKYDMPLNHIKPHGALYGMLARDESLMEASARVAADYGVAHYGLAGTAHERVANRFDLDFVGELYVDLNYNGAGDLVIERKPQITDPEKAGQRVRVALSDGVVDTVEGTAVPMNFTSVCVHSDAPNSVAVATAVREALR